MSRLYVSCGQIRKEIPTGRARLRRSVGLSGQARLDAGENVVLIDLLRFEDDPQDLMAIPGALRADPGKVRHRTRIVMPEGMDLVLYYESKNSFVSARVATALRNKGVRQIRVLVGERIAEMKRLGIK